MALSTQEILRLLEQNAPVIRRYGVRSLGLFGSGARGTARADGDLDFVVEFDTKSFDAYMAQHPEVDARLAEELQGVLGGRAPAVADLPALPYIERVVTESMRLYPPVYGIGREAATPTEVAGHPVPAGGIVIIPTWVVHRDARWFDEPEAYRPERWADDAARRLPRFAYLPFGGGPRQCIGNAFATMEATLILAAIAQRFRLVLMPGQRVTPTPHITLRPEPGIRMRVEPR